MFLSWLYTYFPWIGGVAAIVLLVLLFGTQLLRSGSGSSRWYDLVWLSWLAVAAYLLHNFEEYGIDLYGNSHGFPTDICAIAGFPPYPDCPIPQTFFLAVNIPMFWIAGPLAALSSRRHPLVGLTLCGVIFINALTHTLPLLLGFGYSSGTLTAIILFLPLSAWVAHACFGPGRLPYKAMALLIAAGVIFHIILIGSVLSFANGLIGSTALVAIQFVNLVLVFLITWLGEKSWQSRDSGIRLHEMG